MPIRARFEIVDRNIWGYSNAAEILDLPPVRADIIPGTSYIVGDNGIEEVPIPKDNHPGKVFAVNDVVWPIGGDCAATGRTIFQLDPVQKAAFSNALFNVLERSKYDNTVVIEHSEPSREIDEAIFLNLVSKYWGFRILSLAALAAIREAVGDRKLPLVRYPKRNLEAVDFEAIEMIFGYKPEVITVLPHEFPVKIKKLWFANIPVEWADDRHTFCDEIYQAFHRGFGISEPAEPLRGGVYLTRRDTVRRPIVNDAEVEEFLLKRDVVALTLAPLSIEARMQAMSRAKVIVGAVGSNMFNILFAPPGGWAIEFVPQDWVTRVNGLVQLPRIASAIGRRHIIIPTPDISADVSMSVPLDKLEEAFRFIDQFPD